MSDNTELGIKGKAGDKREIRGKELKIGQVRVYGGSLMESRVNGVADLNFEISLLEWMQFGEQMNTRERWNCVWP